MEGKINRPISIVCIYNDAGASLVAFFLVATGHQYYCCDGTCGISPNRYGSSSNSLWVCVCNLREICVSNMVIHLAGG
jgi:hypothetical protein